MDVVGHLAIFRRVAIRDDRQRSGHGKIMLSLAENFARGEGCSFVRSNVNPEAVGFYQRYGFAYDKSTTSDEKNVPMFKILA
ncbi:MAG: GNAT family N-acetyltransferase [Blastocatellia bacterium]|nr:GNAT family N-acetyltransferase [Blastocatellia bacterium]